MLNGLIVKNISKLVVDYKKMLINERFLSKDLVISNKITIFASSK